VLVAFHHCDEISEKINLKGGSLFAFTILGVSVHGWLAHWFGA
jgi:hypothetical protein